MGIDIKNRTSKNINLIKPFGLRIKDDLNTLELPQKNIKKLIENFSFSKIPPWQIKKTQINLELTKYKKSNTDTNTFKSAYNNLTAKYPNTEFIYTDGSKTSDAVAVAAISPLKNETLTKKINPNASIYTAEAVALDLALDLINNSNKTS